MAVFMCESIEGRRHVAITVLCIHRMKSVREMRAEPTILSAMSVHIIYVYRTLINTLRIVSKIKKNLSKVIVALSILLGASIEAMQML